ncbi:hypothetical protein ACP4OV_028627 [Aristida adscensionis]
MAIPVNPAVTPCRTPRTLLHLGSSSPTPSPSKGPRSMAWRSGAASRAPATSPARPASSASAGANSPSSRSSASPTSPTTWRWKTTPHTHTHRDNEVQLGVAAVPQTGRVRSTPLLRSRMHAGLYYVGLTGIRVDGRDLAGIPPGTLDLAGDGSGGVFLSTTVPVTYLVEDAYEALKQALGSSIQAQPASQGGLCYTAQSMARVHQLPRLTLVFAGVDATMELRQENYFFRFNDGSRDLMCLSVLPSRDASLLGTLMQRGTTMTYNLAGDAQEEQLTFMMDPAPSSQLQAAQPFHAASSLAIVAHVLVWGLLF